MEDMFKSCVVELKYHDKQISANLYDYSYTDELAEKLDKEDIDLYHSEIESITFDNGERVAKLEGIFGDSGSILSDAHEVIDGLYSSDILDHEMPYRLFISMFDAEGGQTALWKVATMQDFYAGVYDYKTPEEMTLDLLKDGYTLTERGAYKPAHRRHEVSRL